MGQISVNTRRHCWMSIYFLGCDLDDKGGNLPLHVVFQQI